MMNFQLENRKNRIGQHNSINGDSIKIVFSKPFKIFYDKNKNFRLLFSKNVRTAKGSCLLGLKE